VALADCGGICIRSERYKRPTQAQETGVPFFVFESITNLPAFLFTKKDGVENFKTIEPVDCSIKKSNIHED
jgi:hypothetical protein